LLIKGIAKQTESIGLIPKKAAESIIIIISKEPEKSSKASARAISVFVLEERWHWE
jgi:hypothetical protein